MRLAAFRQRENKRDTSPKARSWSRDFQAGARGVRDCSALPSRSWGERVSLCLVGPDLELLASAVPGLTCFWVSGWVELWVEGAALGFLLRSMLGSRGKRRAATQRGVALGLSVGGWL